MHFLKTFLLYAIVLASHLKVSCFFARVNCFEVSTFDWLSCFVLDQLPEYT